MKIKRKHLLSILSGIKNLKEEANIRLAVRFRLCRNDTNGKH